MSISAPTDIANCELWLKADGIGGLSDGDPVGTWADSSGNGRDATQGTAGAKPTYKTGIQNGLPIVRFDGGDFLSLPDFLTGYSAGECFGVLKLVNDPPTPTDSSAGAPFGNFGSDSLANHYPYTDGTVYEDFGSTARKTTGNPTPSLASFHKLNMISASGEWTINLNGTQHYTTASNTVGWSTAPLIGRSTSGAFTYGLVGDIAELVLFSRKVTSGERSDMIAYLDAKWFAAAGQPTAKRWGGVKFSTRQQASVGVGGVW
jgi:hypothetical protein